MEASRRKSTQNCRKNKSPAKIRSQTSISDLPEAILLHIISFLPTTDAIRTTAVAPPWRNLWKSLPNIDFDMHYFQEQIPEKSDRLARLLFAEFITQALRRLHYCSPLQKFKLLFFYKNYDHIQAYVNSWIHKLVKLRAVVEIDLEFIEYGESGLSYLYNDEGEMTINDGIENPYSFHLGYIVYSSIEVLKLCNCALHFPVSMKIQSIKKVHLGDFQGEAYEIERLMDLCINLETFSLEYYECHSDLYIVSESLRHLKLIISSSIEQISVEICTPRLGSIEFGRIYSNVVYNFKDISSLVEATVDFEALNNDIYDIGALRWSWLDLASWTHVVSSLTHVEHLSIHNIPQDKCILGSKRRSQAQMSSAELKFGEKVFSKRYAFGNLKHMKLKTWYLEADILSLEVLLEKCPKLETMVLICGSNSHEEEQQEEDETASNLNVNIAFQIPRLRVVKMEGYLGTKNEQYVVDLLKKHGVVLEKIVAFPRKVGYISLPPIVL